jgi:hypothetical protein
MEHALTKLQMPRYYGFWGKCRRPLVRLGSRRAVQR